MPQSSKIFLRYKTLGYVSNHIPVSVRYINRRKENLFVTSVGKSIHTYGCNHFSLLSVSSLLPDDITCMTSDNFMVYTAAGKKIYAWRRGTERKHIYEGHEHVVHLMIALGPHLISIDENSCLKVWDIKTTEQELEIEFDNNSFQVTTLLHPATYLNKILLGSDQGSLQLWNIKTSSLVYTFKGWESSVTVTEQAPALDVVGIGLKNGCIILHNLKYDETVMRFQLDWGAVTALSFRFDGHPILISGTTVGHLVLWDLEERKVASQVLNAHWGAITGLKCLPSEPLMVTSSPDNSLKLWIFDLPDGGARLLRLREGHSLPPNYLRFHGANGQNILSSGGDATLRIFNTVTERFNKSLGRASYNRKASKKIKRQREDPFQMPTIVKFTSETTREKEWDNIAAAHLGIPVVTTWSYHKLKMGNLKLIHDRFDFDNKKDLQEVKYKATATSLCLTHCGNFVLIGYSSGHCDRFNIQSGIFRGGYGNPKSHNGSVRGIATDVLNQVVITGGSDQMIKWWSFKKGEILLTVHQLEENVSFFISHPESALICVALEDFSCVIIDIEARNVIRKFVGHSGRITDGSFSPDSRWLMTSSMDSTICTWDIPAGCLIDYFKVSSPCTSLSFSPTGELLATTHVDNLGIYLWSNKCLYSHVSLHPIVLSSDIPITYLDKATQQEENEITDIDDEEEFKSPEQIHANLITLSSLANSRWQNLLDVDIIKKRNKPKEPPKAPKAAPFFLPTIPSLNLQFDISQAEDGSKGSNEKKFLVSLTKFSKLLHDSVTTNNFEEVVACIKSIGPSAIDFEVTSLTSDTQHSHELLTQFMKMIQYMFETNKNFELAQAYLGLLLKVHGREIAEDEVLCEILSQLKEYQLKGWQRVQDKLFYNLCVINSIKC